MPELGHKRRPLQVNLLPLKWSDLPWGDLPCHPVARRSPLLFQYTFFCHLHGSFGLLDTVSFHQVMFPEWSCIVTRALQRAPLWNVLHSQMCISPPVSAFTVKTKADVLAHFGWLYARGGMEEFPTGTGISHWFWSQLWHWPPQRPLCQLCLSPAGDFGHFSDPTQEVCSRNGTWISCALPTGPSASSLSTFKNKSLLQSFPPHNICSKCSPFLMYPIPCSVANDHSRALLTPCKIALNCFGFYLFSTACYPFLLPCPLYKYFDFPITSEDWRLLSALLS